MTQRAKCASDDSGPRRRALDGCATGLSRWRRAPAAGGGTRTSARGSPLSRLRAPAAHHPWPLTAVAPTQRGVLPRAISAGDPGAKTRERLLNAWEEPDAPRDAGCVGG